MHGHVGDSVVDDVPPGWPRSACQAVSCGRHAGASSCCCQHGCTPGITTNKRTTSPHHRPRHPPRRRHRVRCARPCVPVSSTQPRRRRLPQRVVGGDLCGCDQRTYHAPPALVHGRRHQLGRGGRGCCSSTRGRAHGADGARLPVGEPGQPQPGADPAGAQQAAPVCFASGRHIVDFLRHCHLSNAQRIRQLQARPGTADYDA